MYICIELIINFYYLVKMKKIALSIALVAMMGVSFVSCKDTAKEPTTEEVVTEEVVTEEVVTEEAPAVEEVEVTEEAPAVEEVEVTEEAAN